LGSGCTHFAPALAICHVTIVHILPLLLLTFLSFVFLVFANFFPFVFVTLFFFAFVTWLLFGFVSFYFLHLLYFPSFHSPFRPVGRDATKHIEISSISLSVLLFAYGCPDRCRSNASLDAD
jgi:hypothetical protein